MLALKTFSTYEPNTTPGNIRVCFGCRSMCSVAVPVCIGISAPGRYTIERMARRETISYFLWRNCTLTKNSGSSVPGTETKHTQEEEKKHSRLDFSVVMIAVRHCQGNFHSQCDNEAIEIVGVLLFLYFN